MANMTLRLPDDLDSLLKAEAGKKGQSKHEFIINSLYSLFDSEYDANMVLGWIKADRIGDIEPTNVCSCESQTFENGVWFGISGAIQLIGPFCSVCAESD